METVSLRPERLNSWIRKRDASLFYPVRPPSPIIPGREKHGPHVLRGIEIFKGKPVFYSLGDFIFQNETLLRLPAENYET
jgi:hypothetical protein